MVRVNEHEKTTHNAVMRRFDCACPAGRPKRNRRKRSRRARHAQPHRVTQLRDDGCGLLVPGCNDPTAPISQDEVVLHSLRRSMVHGPLTFSQYLPVQAVLKSILLPWKRPSIYEQVKRPLDMPSTSLVIVTPDDMLSQEKPKLILTFGSEDDDSRPEWSRQQPGDQPAARQGVIRRVQQMRQAIARDAPPTNPTACQPAS